VEENESSDQFCKMHDRMLSECTLDTLGHWDGDFFIYVPPVELPNGSVIRRLRIDAAALAEGLQAEDALIAVAHAVSVMPADDTGGLQLD
jgi:hypothetical protein